MEAIEKMARLCMRDPDEDEEGTDEDDVEADEDLLVSTGPGHVAVYHPSALASNLFLLPWPCIPAGRAKRGPWGGTEGCGAPEVCGPGMPSLSHTYTHSLCLKAHLSPLLHVTLGTGDMLPLNCGVSTIRGRKDCSRGNMCSYYEGPVKVV